MNEARSRVMWRGTSARLAGLGRSSVIRQGAGFAGASIVGSVVGGVVTVLLARSLSVDGYASYSFGISLLGFLTVFFEFGLLVAAARRLSLAEDAGDRDRWLGAASVVLAALALAYCVCVLAGSFFVDALFSVEVGRGLRVSACVAGGWLLASGGLMVAQGAGRVHAYSVATLASKVAFMLVVLVAVALDRRLSPVPALFVQSVALLASFTWMVYALRPTLSEWRSRVGVLFVEARMYGFSVYVGRVLAMGTYNMDVLMLGWFARPRDIAVYSLASSLTIPVGLLPIGLATALFGSMGSAPVLPQRWLRAITLIAALGAAAVGALATPFVHVVLGDEYHEVVAVALVLAVAQGVNGVTRIFNNFLWAHARGRDLRNASAVLTACNLVLNVTLIPRFGAIGAAWASLLSLIVNLGAHVRGYRIAIQLADGSPR